MPKLVDPVTRAVNPSRAVNVATTSCSLYLRRLNQASSIPIPRSARDDVNVEAGRPSAQRIQEKIGWNASGSTKADTPDTIF